MHKPRAGPRVFGHRTFAKDDSLYKRAYHLQLQQAKIRRMQEAKVQGKWRRI